MKTTNELLTEAADRLAATVEKTDSIAWRQLLIYCPDWLILERVKRIKQSE